MQLDGAEVIAAYESSELGANAAITTVRYGAGRVSYVGTVPNPALARSIARWLVPRTASGQWQAELPVTVATGTADERTITFVHNWSAKRHTVTVPVESTLLETGEAFAAGFRFPLEPRGVAVFESSGSRL